MTTPLVESFDDDNRPLIDYAGISDDPESETWPTAALEVCWEYGIQGEKYGRTVKFADENELEKFIDVVDNHRLDKQLLGDLQSALPEDLDTMVDKTMQEALADLEADYTHNYQEGDDLVAIADEIARFYGVDTDQLLKLFNDNHSPKESTTDDVYFQNEIMEMRQRAGLREHAGRSNRAPMVQDIKQLIEARDTTFRNVVKRAYINHAILRGKL